MRQRRESAMGAGMRIAAHHGHARQRRALLRADDMHDTLAHVVHLEFGDAEFIAILVQRIHLETRNRIGNAVLAVGGRHIMVRHREVGGQAPRLAPSQTQALEGLRAGHFMQQMAIDIKQRGAIRLGVHHMGLPQFFVQRLCAH